MSIYNQIKNNRTKTYILFTLFIIIFSGFFYLLGLAYDNGIGYFLLGLLISIASSVGSYFYSDKLVLATTKAKEAKKEDYFDFFTVVENLSIASGVPTPKIYVIDDPSPNAFATGRDPEHAVVCATTGLLDMMERSELEGVIAHELSHIKNYDILVATVTAVLVGSISLVVDLIMRSIWWGGLSGSRKEENRNPFIIFIFLFAIGVTPVVASLIQLAISRKREYLADASGALLTRNPSGLSRALIKISQYPYAVRSATTSTAHLFIANPFKRKNARTLLASLFSTHPPIEKRIEILNSM
ncbi:M48 family metalloprotease [Candidatus Woesebacteria bacterium]|nr:M48 family metalloprotease [Candidatus Woesebacteria bacterium]